MKMLKTTPAAAAAALSLVSALAAAPVSAQAKTLRLCVYDPSGAAGEAYRAATDYRLEMASQTGVEIETRPYTNEKVAVEDFRVDQCDAVMASALRTRQFNGVAAALDSMGAATIVRNGKVDMDASFEVVRKFVEGMAKPQAAELLSSGGYEIAGILPLGAAYAFVNDKSINTLEAASRKRLATFDHDKAQAELAKSVGATAVAADSMNFANMFNNGNVDVVIAPTILYKPLELFRGVGTKGGVSRFPLAILTYQLVIKPDRFPKGYGQKSREYMAQNFELAIASLRLADRGVPVSSWIDPPADAVVRNQTMLRQIRLQMAEQGVYDKRGLKLVKKIRCGLAPEAAECSEPTEN